MCTSPYANATVNDVDAVARREELVMQHLPQVRLIARRIHDRLPGHVSLDDLVSTGVIGLLAAIDNFDPSFNVQLNTYADRKIRGAIMDGLRNMDWAPRGTRKRAKQIQVAIRNVKQNLGREPAEEEIAAELKITLGEYQNWLTELQSLELERFGQENSEDTRDLLNVISSDEASWPSNIVERSELERIVSVAIDRMPKLERTVLSLYYYEELNLREIAEVMGAHLSRIGQLRTHAILRLRSHLERVWVQPQTMRPAA